MSKKVVINPEWEKAPFVMRVFGDGIDKETSDYISPRYRTAEDGLKMVNPIPREIEVEDK